MLHVTIKDYREPRKIAFSLTYLSACNAQAGRKTDGLVAFMPLHRFTAS
jgi:hypothetical protein